ncbi:MAG: helix-turn-helix transcriptional regulator [Tissierellia bacterium]|nr:helix-turn-helix transcriptional regulator [Tissierellia bacterium]
MEIDIGNKIKNARKEKGITQEQAAEILGVSRQTISNWETEKSYPDIISVIKMSEHYDVSLDYLLKGENQMKKYYEYLDESTNVVKSKTRLSKLILVLSYLLIWSITIIVFWRFTDSSDAMGYSLMYIWIILPVSTFVVSLLIGKNDYWGRFKWFAAIAFGIMYMLAEYATFSMANNVSFNKINMPNFSMMFTGMIISVIGIGIGHLMLKKRTG